MTLVLSPIPHLRKISMLNAFLTYYELGHNINFFLWSSNRLVHSVNIVDDFNDSNDYGLYVNDNVNLQGESTL